MVRGLEKQGTPLIVSSSRYLINEVDGSKWPKIDQNFRNVKKKSKIAKLQKLQKSTEIFRKKSQKLQKLQKMQNST